MLTKIFGNLTINRICKSSFFINFLSLNASSVVNKFLTFILFIFLIKYFSASDYGIYTLVWAHVSLLAPFLDLGTTTYGLIHLSNKKLAHFNSLISLRLFFAGIIFILTVVLALLFQYKIDIIIYILLTSIIIFSNTWSGSYLILASVKEKNYLPATVSIFFNIILISSLVLSLFFFKRLTPIFIIIFITYSMYSLFNIYLMKKELINLEFNFDIKNWLPIIKKSSIFILISFFGGLYFKLDVILLKILKTEADVGIYSAGYKFFEALIFIASSYTFVAAPVLAKLISNNLPVFIKRVKRDTLLLGIIGFWTSLIVYIFSPILLPLILHKDYSLSISVLQIVIFSLPFVFISTVIMNALYVLQKAYLVVGLFILQTIFNLTLNFIFIPHYSYFASAYITILGEILNTLILLVFFIKTKNVIKALSKSN